MGQHRKRGGMNFSSASPAAGLCGRGEASSTLLQNGRRVVRNAPCGSSSRDEPQPQHRWSTRVWACPVWAELLCCHRQALRPEQNQQHRNAHCPSPALSTAPFHGQELGGEKKGARKSKTETAVLQGIYFSGEPWCELYTAEMNFAVTREHQDTWPKENTPARFASTEWHWRAERTCSLLSCHLASFSYLWTGQHMWLGEGKNGLPKLWPSTNASVFGKARVQWTLHFRQACPSLLVDAFHGSSISGKGNWNWAWRAACQLFCAMSPWGRRETSLSISAGAFLGGRPQQSRVSTVMPKIFKIHFWKHHLTKDALLSWSYHWKTADR